MRDALTLTLIMTEMILVSTAAGIPFPRCHNQPLTCLTLIYPGRVIPVCCDVNTVAVLIIYE